MPQALLIRPGQLVAQRAPAQPPADAVREGTGEGVAERSAAGFGTRSVAAKPGSKGRKRRGSGLGAGDRSPLGKSPDLEALRARQHLGLALAGRLSATDVTRAWKRAAAEHHPDRGGEHVTMQAINAARAVLLGLDAS